MRLFLREALGGFDEVFMDSTFVSLKGLDFDLIRLRLLILPDFMPVEVSSFNLAGDFVLHRLFGMGDRNFSQKSEVLSAFSLIVTDLDLCFAVVGGMLKWPMQVKAATSNAAAADLSECLVSVSTYITALIWRETRRPWQEDTGDLPCLAREVTTALSVLRSDWHPIRRRGVEGASRFREGTQWVMSDRMVEG